MDEREASSQGSDDNAYERAHARAERAFAEAKQRGGHNWHRDELHERAAQREPRVPGALAGELWVADDFDETPPEFLEEF